MLLLTHLQQKLVDYLLQNMSLNDLQKSFLGPFAPKLIKIAFLKDIQTLIVEHIIVQFLVTRRQMKRFEQGYDFLRDFYIKIVPFCGYFSLVKYFEFMLLKRFVLRILKKENHTVRFPGHRLVRKSLVRILYRIPRAHIFYWKSRVWFWAFAIRIIHI